MPPRRCGFGEAEPVGQAPQFTPQDRVFVGADGRPVRWKGISAFRLLDRFARGEDIAPFLLSCSGFNVLRVWPYVAWSDGWPAPDWETTRTFLAVCNGAGFAVELTLLTDDDPSRIEWANLFLAALAAEPRPEALVIEIGNEPTTHKAIDTPALRVPCWTADFIFASGDYEHLDTMPTRVFGDYTVVHTPRDAEWPRKAKHLREYFDGWNSFGGVGHPCVADEPIRPDDPAAHYDARDFYTYAALAAIMGAGATFHYHGGLQAEAPDEREAACAIAFLAGLTVFPPEAPRGAYRRIDEGPGTLRTYVIGSSMVRVRPTTMQAPESGWQALDELGVAWRRG